MSEDNIRYINPVTGFVDNTTNLIPSTYVPPVANWSMVATLNQATLDVLRQIIREEIDAALDRREQQGLAVLLTSIDADPAPEDEIVAVLAEMTAPEWETLVQRVKARKATE